MLTGALKDQDGSLERATRIKVQRFGSGAEARFNDAKLMTDLASDRLLSVGMI
jgi:hypothetical protein